MDDDSTRPREATHTNSHIRRTPRDKFDDIERGLVRPSSSSQGKNLKKLRLYEDCVERMLRRPYCLSADEISARLQAMQKLRSSYQCVQPRFQACLRTTSAANDEDAQIPSPLTLVGQNPALWSTGRKRTRKRNHTRDSAIVLWPSQELKVMTTISHGTECLSESCKTENSVEGDRFTCPDLMTSQDSTKTEHGHRSNSLKVEKSIDLRKDEADSCKMFDVFIGWSEPSGTTSKCVKDYPNQTIKMEVVKSDEVFATFEADLKKFSESKALCYSECMSNKHPNDQLSERETFLKHAGVNGFDGWSEAFGVRHAIDDQNGLLERQRRRMDPDDRSTCTRRRIVNRRRGVTKVSNKSNNQAQSRDEDAYTKLAEFDDYKSSFVPISAIIS